MLTSDLQEPTYGYRLLEKFNLKAHFDRITFSGEVGYRKPSPKIFDVSCRNLLEKNNPKILHIGDSFKTDVIGITNYRGKAIWITNGKPAPENFEKYQENIIACISDISNLDDLL